MKFVVLDIGTSIGEDIVPNAIKNPLAQFYAFEPEPRCFNKLVSATSGLANVTLINKAVSNFNGSAKFNVSGELDNYTTSSLLNMVDDLSQWPGVEKFFKFVETIDTEVIRLDNFLDYYKIDKVDFLHCDAQGSDLHILEGFGDSIIKLKAGSVEAAIKKDVLYKEQPMVDDVKLFLEKNNFRITEIKPNDNNNNEANISFVNKNYF